MGKTSCFSFFVELNIRELPYRLRKMLILAEIFQKSPKNNKQTNKQSPTKISRLNALIERITFLKSSKKSRNSQNSSVLFRVKCFFRVSFSERLSDLSRSFFSGFLINFSSIFLGFFEPP